MRSSRRRVLATLLGAAGVRLVWPPAAVRAQAPDRSADRAADATVTFGADTVALGLGYSWGGGRLAFKGRDYDFTVTGLSLLGVGADRVEGVGEVRGLRAVEDFEGVYVLAGTGGAFITLSGATAVLRNAKGVELRVRAQGQGLSLAVAAGGARIKLG